LAALSLLSLSHFNLVFFAFKQREFSFPKKKELDFNSTRQQRKMAPNPNECVVVMQMQTPTPQELAGQIIKIVTSDVDSTSEDGEHFYDASSDIGGIGNGGNDGSDDSAPEENNGSNGSNKADSGIEDVTFEIPDAQLAAQIVEQVEFYFSDAHILKDAFLLKHARRNRDGFISLKLITSFKKVTKKLSLYSFFFKIYSFHLLCVSESVDTTV
jgi:hypothetical protein